MLEKIQLNKTVVDVIQTITIAIAFTIIMFIFVITPNEVEGSSMLPTFHSGDRLYALKLSHWLGNTAIGRALNIDYKRGDIVVVERSGSLPLIKRIVALPGEKFKIKDGKVYINNEVLEEKYLTPDTKTLQGSFIEEDKEVTVPENSYIVLGDNRPSSNDSRFIGFVKYEWLQGKIFLQIWPLNSARII